MHFVGVKHIDFPHIVFKMSLIWRLVKICMYVAFFLDKIHKHIYPLNIVSEENEKFEH